MQELSSLDHGAFMEMHLVVVKPFEGFSRGAIITDSANIAVILSGERASSVVRVAAQKLGKA